MKFLNYDSPLMQVMGKIADLLWLNILTVICCIPIITVGPAMTALHYSVLKMVRNEECYVTKDYFKSFKANFKQATIIWLLLLVVFLILAGDYYIVNYSGIEFSHFMHALLTVAIILVFFTTTFVFPVLAKFDNTVVKTIKNAFLIGVYQFPKTILMMVISLAPLLLFIFVPQVIMLILLFGISGPAWISAMLYNKFFRKLEEGVLSSAKDSGETYGGESEDERIFKDELDNTSIEGKES